MQNNMSFIECYMSYHEEYKKKYGDMSIILMQKGKFHEAYKTLDKGPDLFKLTEITNLSCTKANKSIERVDIKNPYMLGFPSSALSKYIKILINNIITAYANSYTFSNSIAAANIDVFSSSTYRSAEYTLQLYDTTLATPAFEITKILIIHDNSNNTYMTEFGQIYNSQLLGTFTSGITSGNLYLQLTPTTANVVCKFIRNTFA